MFEPFLERAEATSDQAQVCISNAAVGGEALILLYNSSIAPNVVKRAVLYYTSKYLLW